MDYFSIGARCGVLAVPNICAEFVLMMMDDDAILSHQSRVRTSSLLKTFAVLEGGQKPAIQPTSLWSTPLGESAAVLVHTLLEQRTAANSWLSLGRRMAPRQKSGRRGRPETCGGRLHATTRTTAQKRLTTALA